MRDQKPSLQSVVLLPLAGLLLLVTVFSVYLAAVAGASLDEKRTTALEIAKPAVIQAAVVQVAACEKCVNPFSVVEEVRAGGLNVSVLAVDAESVEGKRLSVQYGLSRLPAVVARGELEKAGSAFSSEWARVGDALVWQPKSPAFFDVSKRAMVGLVSAVQVVDGSCGECLRYDWAFDSLGRAGVAIGSQALLYSNSSEGSALVQKYNLTILPALVLSADVMAYPQISGNAPKNWSIENDGSLVSRIAFPPFVDLAGNRTVGLVSIVRLTKAACSQCYNVSIHDSIMQGLGIRVVDARNVDADSTEGGRLVAQYGISALPTVLLSPEVWVYPAADVVLKRVGTRENDSVFVFRDMAALTGVVFWNQTSGSLANASSPAGGA